MALLFPTHGALRPLWAHQARAIDLLRGTARAAIDQGRPVRAVAKIPTGGGKIVLAAHIISGLFSRGQRVAFCVPMLSLIDQSFARFVENGLDPADIGVLQADHPWRRLQARLQICSTQTLGRRGFPEVTWVLVDEVHIRFRVIDRWMDEHPAVNFLGFSATPWSAGMGDRWHALVNPTSLGQLIAEGRLSKFRVFASSHPDLSAVKVTAGDYQVDELSGAMSRKKIIADVVTNWLEKGENRPTLAFLVDRPHAALIHDQFTEAGVSSAYVDGETDRDERETILVRFRRGDVQIICSVGTMTTGIDEDIRCIILARPTRSKIMYTQMVGRGLRTAEGKTNCLIFDHTDTTLNLGLPTDIDQAHLRTAKRDAKEKRRDRRQEAAKSLPRECVSCHTIVPPRTPVCPQCGFRPQLQPTVETLDGKLVELRAGKQSRVTVPTIADQATFHAELLWFAREHRYSSGWVAHKFRERFGVWPDDWRIKRVVPTPPTLKTKDWIRSRQIAYARGANHG